MMRPNGYAELQAFVAVAETLSFRKAAERLALKASTLSHALRALEERLGVRLLNRTTRSVAVTAAGAALLAEVGPALRAIDAALAAVNAHAGEVRGRLRINSPHLAADLVLRHRLAEFAALYPDVVLDLALDDSFVDIVGDGYDAGVRLGESLAQDMVAVAITAPLRIAVVGAPAYFARRPQPIGQPADLQAHACIGYRATGSRVLYRWEFERDGRKVDLTPQGPLVLDSHALLVQAARDGAGLAYAIEAAVQDDLASGALHRVLDDWCPPFAGFHLYYPSRRQLAPALRALIDFLKVR